MRACFAAPGDRECCHACFIAATGTTTPLRVERPLTERYGRTTNDEGIFRDVLKARDRQQELFVVVAAAVPGAARQHPRPPPGFHPPLYRVVPQAPGSSGH